MDSTHIYEKKIYFYPIEKKLNSPKEKNRTECRSKYSLDMANPLAP